MEARNYGICEQCGAHVRAVHEIRDGKVYLRKDCPECGPSEGLVSSSAERWQRKRDICHYDPDTAPACDVHCTQCNRRADHHPRMVFLDVTNRCNMNCPICIANIPGMGFEFNPPLDYFERVFDGLAAMNPKPRVQLFGGEPTVRDDLFDIIRMGRERGLRIGMVTNGLKLADEDYCRRVCESRIRVLFSFDGRSPEIYERLRKNPSAYEKKVKGLENLKKFSDRKNTIMSCVARDVNDKHMRDLIDWCHESRDIINFLHLIPLTETWEHDEFEVDITTTIEDVEEIIDEAFPGEPVEFVPSALTHHLTRALTFFGGVRLTFGGVHPNCESATMLVGNAERYRPLSAYLKRPLDEICEEIVTRAERIEERLDALDPESWLQRQRGRLLVLRTFLGLGLRSIDFRTLLKGNRFLTATRILGGLLLGRRFKDQLRRHSRVQHIMGMLILPFEEVHSIEGARLHNCTAGFAFEDPDDGQVKTIPVCAWGLYQRPIEQKISEVYGVAASAARGCPRGRPVPEAAPG
jgi:hypothetical protein